MSRHIAKLVKDGKEFEFVMGFDKPTNEIFWQLFDTEEEMLSTDSPDEVLYDLFEQYGLDEFCAGSVFTQMVKAIIEEEHIRSLELSDSTRAPYNFNVVKHYGSVDLTSTTVPA